MKSKIKILLSFIMITSIAFYACNSDNDTALDIEQDIKTDTLTNVQERKGRVNEIDYHPEVDCPLSGPSCVLQGGSTTFTISCLTNPNGNVYWTWQSGVGISPTTPLGPGGLGTSSQSFTFSSNFQQGWIQAVCDGSFGCKDQITALPCSNNPPPPTCYISGPGCGFDGDQLTFSYSGGGIGTNVIWSASGGMTLDSGQNTTTATFQLPNPFSGGTITATKFGNPSCSVTFDVDNCCDQNMKKVDNLNRVTKN